MATSLQGGEGEGFVCLGVVQAIAKGAIDGANQVEEKSVQMSSAQVSEGNGREGNKVEDEAVGHVNSKLGMLGAEVGLDGMEEDAEDFVDLVDVVFWAIDEGKVIFEHDKFPNGSGRNCTINSG